LKNVWWPKLRVDDCFHLMWIPFLVKRVRISFDHFLFKESGQQKVPLHGMPLTDSNQGCGKSGNAFVCRKGE